MHRCLVPEGLNLHLIRFKAGMEFFFFFFFFLTQPTCFLGGFIGFNVFFWILLGLMINELITEISCKNLTNW